MREAATILKNIWSENEGVDKLKYIFSAIVWQFQKKLGKSFLKKIHVGGGYCKGTALFCVLTYFLF